MEQRIVVPGPHLWTRERGRELRPQVAATLEALAEGDVLVLDLGEVQAFDYSFAAEYFGRTILSLMSDHPGLFVIVEGLTEYTRENLTQALSGIGTGGVFMIERLNGAHRLIGKVHPADTDTFQSILEAAGPVSSADVRDELNITLNAANERLSKLAGLGVIRRERGRSSAGREQYLYRTLS